MLRLSFPIKKRFDNLSNISFDIISSNEINQNDISMLPGYLYSITGNNGAGKTTLMNIISTLTSFDGHVSSQDGQLLVNIDGNKEFPQFAENVRDNLFSFIFQDAHLINFYTIEENLLIVNDHFQYYEDLKLILGNIKRDNPNNRFDSILRKIDKFILEQKNTPYYLSGGEKQLLSFIRAMIKPSQIIFADEPWASMDIEMKTFIEHQFYKYLNNQDAFYEIRTRNIRKSEKNMVIIISHPVHHQNHTPLGDKDDGWCIDLVVNYRGDIGENSGSLKFERYNLNNTHI